MISIYARLAAGAGILALLGGLYWYAYEAGKDSVIKDYQGQISEQISKAADDMYAMAERSAELERLKNLQLDLLSEQLAEAEREVAGYANSPAKKCVVSPQFKRAADAATRVLRDPVPAERVPSASAPSTIDGKEAGPVYDGAVSRTDADRGDVRVEPMTDAVAVFAMNDCSAKLSKLWVEYESTDRWAEEMYTMQLAAAGRTLLPE